MRNARNALEVLKPGDKVGARRWPNSHAHPDTWSMPHCGVVLSVTDPRAWAFTIDFMTAYPHPELVRQHVAKLREASAMPRGVPVLWDLGLIGERVYWEDLLRPYTADLALWSANRRQAYHRVGGPALAMGVTRDR